MTTIELQCENCGGLDSIPVGQLSELGKEHDGVYPCPYGCKEKSKLVFKSITEV